ncbi:hypothetical protein ATW7_12628 [Alteromonadales bacterium TW-7]|nr:hypothetical protein ATW7_12628 [Alteromonadales bacterium TW-7]
MHCNIWTFVGLQNDKCRRQNCYVFMRMNRLLFLFLSLFFSGCALIGSPSFEKDAVVNDGELKSYTITLTGKMPNMVHDESQMFWPTYHDVFYKIHIDELSGVINEDNFLLTYKDKAKNLSSYTGTLTFKGSELIISLRNCPYHENCFNAYFNGSYKLKNKI